MSAIKMATWNVRFTLPKGDPKGEPNWAKNMTIVAVCDSIDMAIALVRTEHPAAHIYGITHKGQDFTVFDPKVLPTYVALPNGGSSG